MFELMQRMRGDGGRPGALCHMYVDVRLRRRSEPVTLRRRVVRFGMPFCYADPGRPERLRLRSRSRSRSPRRLEPKRAPRALRDAVLTQPPAKKSVKVPPNKPLEKTAKPQPGATSPEELAAAAQGVYPAKPGPKAAPVTNPTPKQPTEPANTPGGSGSGSDTLRHRLELFLEDMSLPQPWARALAPLLVRRGCKDLPRDSHGELVGCGVWTKVSKRKGWRFQSFGDMDESEVWSHGETVRQAFADYFVLPIAQIPKLPARPTRDEPQRQEEEQKPPQAPQKLEEKTNEKKMEEKKPEGQKKPADEKADDAGWLQYLRGLRTSGSSRLRGRKQHGTEEKATVEVPKAEDKGTEEKTDPAGEGNPEGKQQDAKNDPACEGKTEEKQHEVKKPEEEESQETKKGEVGHAEQDKAGSPAKEGDAEPAQEDRARQRERRDRSRRRRRTRSFTRSRPRSPTRSPRRSSRRSRRRSDGHRSRSTRRPPVVDLCEG